MELARLFFFAVFIFSLVQAQDSPNNDSDDDLPSCAASCQTALGSLTSACGDSGAIGQFNSCVAGSSCSDDDQEGSGDWITSTCRVISRSMERSSQSATRTSASVTATTTPASTSATTTASSSMSATSASSTSTSVTSTSSPTPQSSGLSTGAKTGLGLGIALGALLLLAALIFFCARRMRNSRRASKAAWPATLFSHDDAAKATREFTLDGSERGFAGAGKFEPRDPYSEPRSLPEAPELGGVMRSELHGREYRPTHGVPQMRELMPRGTVMHELPHEGAVVAGPLRDSRRIPRKGVVPVSVMAAAADESLLGAGGERAVQQEVSEDKFDGEDALGWGGSGYRPVSTMSHVDGGELTAGARLPQSPVSPTSPTGRNFSLRR